MQLKSLSSKWSYLTNRNSARIKFTYTSNLQKNLKF